MIKRGFDFIFALLSLVILFPLLLIIAIIIKLDSKGPVLFIQERVGQHNIEFNILYTCLMVFLNFFLKWPND